MKTIEVDDELYRYIASHTQHIGESASDILRRMLKTAGAPVGVAVELKTDDTAKTVGAEPALAAKDKVRAVRELLLSDDYARHRRAVNRFLLLLSTLHGLDAGAFAQAAEALHGRTRLYFAANEQTLLQNGRQTKPKQVPGTSYWVITNTNTGRKRNMIEHMMRVMQFPDELIGKVCGTI